MLRRLTPYLIAAAVALASTLGFVSVAATGAPGEHADYVIIAGAATFALPTPKEKGAQASPNKPVKIDSPDGIGANLPDQDPNITELNQEQANGTQPGALAEAVRCTAAVGPGAAIAAARPYGRIDRYRETLPEHPEGLLSGCVLSIVDLGTIAGDASQVRQAAARQADQTLA